MTSGPIKETPVLDGIDARFFIEHLNTIRIESQRKSLEDWLIINRLLVF